MAKINEQFDGILTALGLTESQLADTANLDNALRHIQNSRCLPNKMALKRMFRRKASDARDRRHRQEAEARRAKKLVAA
ncbi:MAG TPA: hypothetical protein VLF21_01205 [Candidatus Saccharimonadales bacterium]|nr:hypothetical protein [Candidatus Saccharimonadales bacterium]